uniref:(northern house mosquito) hypothetical protein n=1 Tax=Culex pipiens TaxID=7175 RepID=A0A8D8HFD0_CULPI
MVRQVVDGAFSAVLLHFSHVLHEQVLMHKLRVHELQCGIRREPLLHADEPLHRHVSGLAQLLDDSLLLRQGHHESSFCVSNRRLVEQLFARGLFHRVGAVDVTRLQFPEPLHQLLQVNC